MLFLAVKCQAQQHDVVLKTLLGSFQLNHSWTVGLLVLLRHQNQGRERAHWLIDQPMVTYKLSSAHVSLGFTPSWLVGSRCLPSVTSQWIPDKAGLVSMRPEKCKFILLYMSFVQKWPLCSEPFQKSHWLLLPSKKRKRKRAKHHLILCRKDFEDKGWSGR